MFMATLPVTFVIPGLDPGILPVLNNFIPNLHHLLPIEIPGSSLGITPKEVY